MIFPPTNWLELYVKSLICGFLDFFLLMVKSNHCIFEIKGFPKPLYIKSNIQPENFVKLDISKISIFSRELSILVSSNCSLRKYLSEKHQQQTLKAQMPHPKCIEFNLN